MTNQPSSAAYKQMSKLIISKGNEVLKLQKAITNNHPKDATHSATVLRLAHPSRR